MGCCGSAQSNPDSQKEDLAPPPQAPPPPPIIYEEEIIEEEDSVSDKDSKGKKGDKHYTIVVQVVGDDGERKEYTASNGMYPDPQQAMESAIQSGATTPVRSSSRSPSQTQPFL